MKKNSVMRLVGIIGLGLLLTILLPITNSAQAAGPVKWVLTSPFGAESYGGKGTAWIIDRIKSKSGGKLLIEPYYAGSLGYKSPEYLKIFKDGLVDMAELSPPHVMGSEPLFGACVLPFTYFSYDKYYDFAHKTLIPTVSGVIEKKWNVKVIGNLMYAQTGFYSQKAIRSEADFKGLQIRAMTGFDTKIYSAVGGMPTVIPWAELYTALQRKVVTSMPNSLNAAADIKVWEVTSHFSLIGYVIGTGFLVVNKKSFDKLPADLQAVVTEAGKAYSLHQKEAITNIGNASLYQFLDHGMTLTKMPDPIVKKLRKAAQGVWSSWAEKVGPKGEEILKGAGLLE